MNKTKTLLASGLLLFCLSMHAELVEGIIVNDGADKQQFAISDILEITFSDNGLAVVTTDDVTIEFSPDWQITFGLVDYVGVPGVIMSQSDAVATIYDIQGKLVTESRLSDIRFGELQQGIYILKCNGKSLKIKK